mgnify:CR=1 FL=1
MQLTGKVVLDAVRPRGVVEEDGSVDAGHQAEQRFDVSSCDRAVLHLLKEVLRSDGLIAGLFLDEEHELWAMHGGDGVVEHQATDVIDVSHQHALTIADKVVNGDLVALIPHVG